VTKRKQTLSKVEIAQAFADGTGAQFPPIMTVDQLAALLQKSRKTVYEWAEKGRLDGAFRKRGKHILFWRDRVIDIIFNGPEWDHHEKRTRTNSSGPVHGDLQTRKEGELHGRLPSRRRTLPSLVADEQCEDRPPTGDETGT
jgi:excisionase family DNA binding protein